MVRYGRDAFEDQEGGERRGGYLADARMETPPFAETCWRHWRGVRETAAHLAFIHLSYCSLSLSSESGLLLNGVILKMSEIRRLQSPRAFLLFRSACLLNRSPPPPAPLP